MRILFFILFLLACSFAGAQVVSTYAGYPDVAGAVNGTGSAARFNQPHGIACDKWGNVYVADRNNHMIRKISPGGAVTTLAGSGTIGWFDGTGAAAQFNEPWGVACDTAGNVYVADTKNYKIRMITPSGVTVTIAGDGTFGTQNGPASLAKFGFPTGVCVAADGTIYVADHMTHTIRKISGGVVSTLAGTPYLNGSSDGQGAAAEFYRPYGIDFDNNGDIIVADEWNHLIRKVTPSGNVTTLAGIGIVGSINGQTSAASFNYPWDVTVDSAGIIYVADGYNHIIRKIDLGANNVSTFAGTPGVAGSNDGIASAASFDGATGIAFSPSESCFYVADCYNNIVRKIAYLSSITITLTSNVSGNKICLGDSVTLTASPAGLFNYVFSEGAVVLGVSANGIITLPGLSAGNHSITCSATDSTGGIAFSSPIIITVNAPPPPPSINTGGQTTLCSNDSVLLTAPSGYSYLWSNGATTQTTYATAPGAYAVTITNANGCKSVSPAVQINSASGTTVTIQPSGNTTICPGDSVLLAAVTNNPNVSYYWSNGSTSQTIAAAASGIYTVSVTDSTGCAVISLPQQVFVHNQTSSSITPSGYVIMLMGDSVLLSANSANAYQWSTGASTQNIMAGDSGIYTLTATDSNGCFSTPASVTVIIVGSLTLSVLGNDTICEGDSVMLFSNQPQGNQWYQNNNPIAGATLQNYWVTASGDYHVRLTTTNGNYIDSSPIHIEVLTLPASVPIADSVICSGSAVLLIAQPQTNCTYYWFTQPAGGSAINTGLTYLTPSLSQTTSYYIEIHSTNGCISKTRDEVKVTVLPAASASFTHTAISNGSSFAVTFSNTSASATFYSWNFGDTASANNTSSSANPTHIYSQAGTYTVMLIAYNSLGCADTLVRDIRVSPFTEIFVPNSFTPNADGINDELFVRGNDIAEMDFRIYNQWGETIFASTQQADGWKGIYNGEPVQNGSYVYTLALTMADGKMQTLKGKVNVIR